MRRMTFERRTIHGALAAAPLILLAMATPGRAQTPPDWDMGVTTAAPPAPKPDEAAPAPSDGNTTVIPRSTGDKDAQGSETAQVHLVALLTADGQRIDQGLVWRVFREKADADGKTKLVNTYRDASPVVKLRPGDYVINAAFGRAHLTRKVTVQPGGAEPAVEQFVLNAGGLRVTALIGGKPAQAGSVSYSIYSDRDQSDSRKLVMSGAKPALVMRLNAGIYHVVSTYGDANATVSSDVTVEAGKLTEATIAHAAAKATFKLVARAGGEALPDTQWSIQTPQGEPVKESIGALPSHILAPGTYTVVAKWQGKAFRREFTLTDGEMTQVEVVIQ